MNINTDSIVSITEANQNFSKVAKEDYFCGSHNFDTGGKYQEFCTPYSGLSKVIKPDGLYSSQQRFSIFNDNPPEGILLWGDLFLYHPKS
ncbi:MAG: hypothetical protein SPL89_01035 [Clostridia bacterium]|nr:hypothetical protein [Clostridia bacterium]